MAATPHSSTQRAFLQLHIAIVLAGFTAVLGRLISLSEGVLVWWRLLLAVLAFGVLMFAKKRAFSKRHILQYLGVGAIVGLHWVCFFGSVKYGSISIALVCFSAVGFFSAVLEPLLQRKPWMPVELLLGLVCIVGIAIIYHFDSKYKLGIVLGVVAAALAALFSIFNKQLTTTGDAIAISFWEMLGALVAVSALLPWYIGEHGRAFWPLGYDWLWLGLLAIACTVWAFLLQLKALRVLSAVTLNLSYNLEPVYGILLAFIFFKEQAYFNASFFVGLGLITAAVALQTLRVWRQPHQQNIAAQN